MSAELSLLYAIGIGTLLVAAAATLWDRRFHASSGRGLGFWAAGYVLLAAGCSLLGFRTALPPMLGFTLASTLTIAGYGTLVAGLLAFAGHRRDRSWAFGCAALAIGWSVPALIVSQTGWYVLASVWIAAICGAGALVLLRAKALSTLRARHLGALVFGLHAATYALRIALVPLFEAAGDPALKQTLALATMVEGILFSAAAPMALMFLTREEREGRLRAEATTDFLTGLDNRRGFMGKADAFLARRDARSGDPAALVLFDLDHFKSINDRYGHSAGDRVLKLFCEILEGTMRPQDLAGRLGGEEFAVLMPDRDMRDARLAAEAVRTRFSRAVAQSPDFAFSASVSGGLVDVPAGRDLHELLAEADRLLYRAKALGRDRVETGGNDPWALGPPFIPVRPGRTPRSPAAAA